MDSSTTSGLVLGTIIASMAIVRVVRLINGHSFASLMGWDRWERVAYQGAMAGMCVLLAVERGGILLWLMGALLAIIAIGFAFKPPQSRPVNSPTPKAGGKSESD